MKKIITWIDPQGRYRVTSPAYDSAPPGETEDETIARVLVRIKARYGLPDTHEFHLVEDADQRVRVIECAGTGFRYGVFDTDARAGAWEMDADGRPKVNMVKARPIKTDMVRKERAPKLAVLDVEHRMAAGDTAKQALINKKAQELRDLPATIQPDLDAITTPEALEAWTPPWPE